MNRNDTQKAIESGETALGIEFGSTRIKAVLIGEDHAPIASGSHEWENRYENGIWTYSLEDVWKGLQESYRNLSNEILEKYNTPLRTIGAIGFSGMMHGYLAFDKDGNLLACEGANGRVVAIDAKGNVTVVADKYDGINRSEVDDEQAELQEPCWGEMVEP